MSVIEPEALLAVAKNAAQEGARVLEDAYKHYHLGDGVLAVDTKTSAIDVVTEIDGKAQETIIGVIQSHFPEHRFLAEEEGADHLGDPSSPYVWIIDPLDGTQNFVHGKKDFGSIVGLMKDEELLLGAMNLPLLHDEYYGGIGLGAFYNDKPIALRNTKGMSDAILCCNIMHRAKQREDGSYYVDIPYCASVENYGCAAQEIGQILQGHTDGVFFDGIKLWDVCTGYVLLKEAGGNYMYTFKEPGNLRSGMISSASTTPIFEELRQFAEHRL